MATSVLPWTIPTGTVKHRQSWKAYARTVYGLRLVREPMQGSTREDGAVTMASPRAVFTFMVPLADVEVAETFWVLPLDAQHRLIGGGPIAITRGILNSSLVHAREVFRAAIVAGAAAVILCHNHPSGDPSPSADDRSVTEHLRAAGQLLCIPVHDHVIIGAGRYVSFAEMGLL